MNIIKKTFSLILILLQLIITYAMANEVILPADAIDDKNKAEIRLMIALSVMAENEDGDFLSDSNVTRAEFAQMIVRALGLESVVTTKGGSGSAIEDEWQGTGIDRGNQTVVSKFSDLSFDHWAYDYIITLNDLKLMGGFTDGSFQPDRTIPYEQMLVVMVKALGLDLYAQSKGGYPIGYIYMASNNKLLTGINKSTSQNLTRSETAVLFSNFLSVDIAIEESFGNGVSLNRVPGQNLMTENLKIKKAKGLVTGNEMTNLYSGGVGAISGRIKIDGDIFITDNIDISALLGKRVTYYYRTDEPNEGKIVLINASENDNIITEIEMEDFYAYTDGNISYERDDKEKRTRVPDDIPIIFNGVYYDIVKNINFSELRSYLTTLRLLDNDNDNRIDILFIDSYKTYVIKNVDTKGEIIYVTDVCSEYIMNLENDRKGHIPLDLGTDDIERKYFKDGILSDESALKSDRIISVGESRNQTGKKWMTLHISTAAVSGSIDMISDDEITIGDQIYKLVPEAKIKLSVKLSGTYLLDFKKRIAYYTAGTAALDYAYLVDAITKKNVEKTLVLKLFTRKNVAVEELAAAERVSYKEEGMITSDKLFEKLSDSQGKINRQLIAYSTDADGLIKSIYTAEVYTNWSDTDNTLVMQRSPVGVLSTYTDTTGMNGPGARKERQASRNNFEDFILSKNGVIFDLSSKSETNWKLETVNFIKDSRKYNCLAYNISVANVAEFMVIPPPDNYTSKSVIPDMDYYDDKSVVISKIIRTTDADGNPIFRIDGYKYGANVSYTFDIEQGGDKTDKLQVGDCWQIEASLDNKIVRCSEVFDASQSFYEGMTTYRKRTSGDDIFDISLGYVREIGEEAIVIGIDTNDTFLNKKLLWTMRINQWGTGSTHVAWYDVKTKKLEVKSTADIMPDDLIFATSGWNTLNQIIVIKNYK